MNSLPDFTSFDILVVVLLLFFLARGLWVGFMRQLAAFFGLIGGYWLAARYHGLVAPFAQQYIDNPKVTFLVCFGCVFLLAALGFGLLGKLLRKVMEISLLGWFDRALGDVWGCKGIYSRLFAVYVPGVQRICNKHHASEITECSVPSAWRRAVAAFD